MADEGVGRGPGGPPYIKELCGQLMTHTLRQTRAAGRINVVLSVIQDTCQ